MNRFNYKCINRIFAMLICISFVFIFFFCESFIIGHANHYCTGEECSICIQIQHAENIISQISKIIFILFILVSAIFFIKLLIINTIIQIKKHTLIDLKVRMNN
jgi:hypothetical protein